MLHHHHRHVAQHQIIARHPPSEAPLLLQNASPSRRSDAANPPHACHFSPSKASKKPSFPPLRIQFFLDLFYFYFRHHSVFQQKKPFPGQKRNQGFRRILNLNFDFFCFDKRYPPLTSLHFSIIHTYIRHHTYNTSLHYTAFVLDFVTVKSAVPLSILPHIPTVLPKASCCFFLFSASLPPVQPVDLGIQKKKNLPLVHHTTHWILVHSPG